MAKIKQAQPVTDRRWNYDTYGTYVAGQAAIDGADVVAIEMERRWGAGRLRLLVGVELRERFDRQDFLYRQAIHHGDLEEVQRQAGRMIAAYRGLNLAAEAAGASRLAPEVWEVALKDGTVAAIVQTYEDAREVVTSGRRVAVYTLEELAHMLDVYQRVTKVKEVFPGAEVVQIRQSISDPLAGVPDGVSLNDRLDDIEAFRM